MVAWLSVALACVAAPALLRAQVTAFSPDRSGFGVQPWLVDDPTTGLQRFALELGFAARGTARDQQLAFSPLLSAAFGVDPGWRVEVDWGAVALSDVADDGATAVAFAASNPAVAARYRWLDRPETRGSVVFGVTGPVAYRGADSLAGQRRAGLALAAGMRGLWDAWRWAPGQSGAAVGLALDRVLGESLSIALEGDVATSLAISDATDDMGDLYGQLAVELSAGPPWLAVGLRAQGVAVTADGDPLQFAVAPQVTWAPGSLRLRGQALINLDPPLGVLSNGLRLWGLLLAAELRP